jgi:hypothetical protein
MFVNRIPQLSIGIPAIGENVRLDALTTTIAPIGLGTTRAADVLYSVVHTQFVPLR